ncbi:MAG TPA: hypothetical protein DCP36_00170 [Sporomusaceae bacterium]|nr:hypothetical protein [Sporomusaceae bacterium]
MSTSDRKIGFYNFAFHKHGRPDDELYFDRELFKDFLEDVTNLPETERLIRIEQYNKAICLETIVIDPTPGGFLIKVLFKSCKYNHNPKYMSSIDGSERETDKQPEEGEKEKTHLCMRINNLEAKVVLEERRSGITITGITNYLNNKLREYLTKNEKPKNFKLIYGIVPVGGFLQELERMSRLKISEIYTYKYMIGSEAYGLLDKEDLSMKEEIVITAKAKPKESLAKRTGAYIYNQITAEDSKVSRIRIYGNDQAGKDVMLDSLLIKKMEFINTTLDNDGTVNTASILGHMMVILGDEE